MSLWMQVPGITGTCEFTGYTGWIKLAGLKMRARRSMNMEIGSNTDREKDTPVMSELLVSKPGDIASGHLQQLVLDKVTAQTVAIVNLRTDDPPDPRDLKTLTDCIFSSYLLEGGDDMLETYTLNFTLMESKFAASSAKGAPGSPFSWTFDRGKGKCT
jgi:type VI protein secretion system component Hcp